MIPVVFSTDHNFVMPTGVAMQSLLENSKDEDVEVFILQSNSVTDDDRKVLQLICDNFKTKLEFLSMGELFNDGFEIRGITIVSYYRLLIPWLIPKYDKVVYCDGDVVFCGSVKQLYDIELENNLYAAICPYKHNKHIYKDHAVALGLQPNNYYQAGVLLINSKAQRDANLRDVYLKEAMKKYVYQDQDIINVVCQNRIQELPIRFNVTQSLYRSFIQKESPVIIHYSGVKPWDKFVYGWWRWWEVYRRSPFYDNNREFLIFDNSFRSSLSRKRITYAKMVKSFLKKIFPGD
jgi:lipopolysaccharide biosynthesis glycosyltransferase